MPRILPRPASPLPRRQAPRLAALALLATLLSGCGSDGGTEPRTVVVVTPQAVQRVAGETQQFSATVDGSGAAGQVTWTSSDTDVATIDPATGLATALSAGTTTIRATASDGLDSATLTVIANTAPTVNAGADVDVARSANVSLAATGTDAQAQALTYRWTQFAGPDVTGGAGFLTGATPSFTAPATVGVIAFSVVASDASLPSAPDTVRVYVLEDPAKAVWVRIGAAGTPDGTRGAPYPTISAAIAAAAATGADVYASRGTYAAVTLASGVSVYGGFEIDWTVRHPISQADRNTVVRGIGTALFGDGVANLTIDGLRIEGLQSLASGSSTYGMRLLNASNVTVSRNVITAEAGRAGASGTTGGNGSDGTAGLNAASRIGGQGRGPYAGFGGQGGDGGTGTISAEPGDNGIGFGGGTGGPPATSEAGGGAGDDGDPGVPGASGGGAATSFTFSSVYVPNTAGTGAPGGFGGGGGGGGGGRNVYVFPIGDYNGGGGGGGGGGGTGGGGGGAGQGGGASVGLLLQNPTDVVVVENTIVAGNGGNGGAGGAGGSGGIGAPGGSGYDPSDANDGRHGGPGGRGGNGGIGGSGGGGAGGPSVGIARVGGTWTNAGNAITAGTAGTGGSPNGSPGWAAAVRD